ncbi:MAG TPA: hypothetical protein VGX03_16190 [Candidatus Binatia bacterium]|nr:hypothetical protein [Candidatus Binatia bacterium]
MKVISRQQLLLPAVEPLPNPLRTAARTGPVPTGVVPDLGDVALRAPPHVAAQHGRATLPHGSCGSPHPPRQLVRLGIRRKGRL